MASRALPDLPRVTLLDGPTPLQRLSRLSAALGDRSELWIKREDLGPLAFSGNKLRNLEFLLGAAVADGATAVVTSGRRWSNHCRLTAAAGARLGLGVTVVVSGPQVDGSANLGLIRELGATVRQARTDDRAERAALVDESAAELEAAGHRVRVLPVGGSEPTGAWGQALGFLEAIDQSRHAGFIPDAIVLPTATGGTQAGLIVGAALAREACDVEGVIVAHGAAELRPKIAQLVDALAALAGIPVPSAPILLDDSQLGDGYGLPAASARAAASLLAGTEGILVDPVYTAKAMAALVSDVRSGRLDGRRVLFWHGGGLPALFEDL